MKRYLKLSLITLVFIFSFSMIPNLAKIGVAAVSLQYPTAAYINDYIYVDGVVEERNKKEIFSNLPIVPSEVNFTVGDVVAQGEVIATVDINQTRLAVLNLVETASQIPKEYIGAISNLSYSSEYIKSVIPTEILAEKSGKITSMTMVEGAISYPKLPLCTISDTGSLRVNMNVNELDCDRVQKGDSVSFKATATKDEVYHGKVSRVFPTAQTTLMGSEKQTVVGFYVELNEVYEKLKPGYTVTGVVKKGEPEICLTVPYEAIGQDENNREFLYTKEKNRAKKLYVKTGAEFKSAVQITAGIDEDTIIIKNAGLIKKDGQRVRVTG